jgi:hypothetical protein
MLDGNWPEYDPNYAIANAISHDDPRGRGL